MDFSIVEKAGLRSTDIAEILGVSRASVSFWTSGKCSPSKSKPYTKKLEITLDTLFKLVEVGKLPKPNGDRKDIVRRIKAFVDNQD